MWDPLKLSVSIPSFFFQFVRKIKVSLFDFSTVAQRRHSVLNVFVGRSVPASVQNCLRSRRLEFLQPLCRANV